MISKAMTAALVVAAVTASSASLAHAAPEFHCTSTSANCWITSDVSADSSFTTSNGTFKCTSASVKGTAPKTATTLTMSATYEGCKVFGGNAPFNMKSCDYLFHLPLAGSAPFPLAMDVVCTGEPITISQLAIACVITIGGQTGLAGVVVSNAGTEPTHTTATIHITSITYTYTEAGEGCSAPGTHKNGVYNGTLTITGFEDQANGTEGTKVGLHVF